MKCRKCGSDNAEQMSFCTACGESLKGDAANTSITEKQNQPAHTFEKTNCHVCNTKISKDTIYCHMCGSRQKAALTNTQSEIDGFGTDGEKKIENESVDKCSACGTPVPSGKVFCASCAKSKAGSPEEQLLKSENRAEKAIKPETVEILDSKKIEPMIAMIARMNDDGEKEDRQQELDQSKDEKQKKEYIGSDSAGEKKAEKFRAKENISSVALEFLPTEDSEESAAGAKFRIVDDVVKQIKAQNEKKQQSLENGAPKETKPETTPDKKITINAESDQPNTASENQNSEQISAEQLISKVFPIETQITKSEKTKPDNAVAGTANKSSLWSSVPVSSAVLSAGEIKQENKMQPELPGQKDTAEDNAPAQPPVLAKAQVDAKQENKIQPELLSRKDTAEESAPAQPPVPTKPPEAAKQENKLQPELPGRKDIAEEGAPAQPPVPTKPPVDAKQEHKMQPDLPSRKDTAEESAPAQPPVPTKPLVDVKQEHKLQPELPGRKDIAEESAPAQPPMPTKPPVDAKQEHKLQPELSGRKNAAEENAPTKTTFAMSDMTLTSPTASADVAPRTTIEPNAAPKPQVSKSNTAVSSENNKAASDIETKKKGKKAVFAILVILIIIVMGAAFSVFYMVRSSNYDEAVQYMDDGQYKEAYAIFVKLASYKDSAAIAAECYNFIKYDEAVELMNNASYEDAAKIFAELGDFENSVQLFDICTLFCDAMDFYNEERYWYAYSKFEELKGYGDSREWMEKCVQDTPVNGVADTGEAYAEGTASIKIVNSTELDAYFIFNSVDGRYWGGIYIRAGADVVVSIKSGEYSADLAAGTMWFGKIDMFGRGQEASYQKNVPFDENGSTSFFITPDETKIFTIYS